jgi:hypothetical protein
MAYLVSDFASKHDWSSALLTKPNVFVRAYQAGMRALDKAFRYGTVEQSNSAWAWLVKTFHIPPPAYLDTVSAGSQPNHGSDPASACPVGQTANPSVWDADSSGSPTSESVGSEGPRHVSSWLESLAELFWIPDVDEYGARFDRKRRVWHLPDGRVISSAVEYRDWCLEQLRKQKANGSDAHAA